VGPNHRLHARFVGAHFHSAAPITVPAADDPGGRIARNPIPATRFQQHDPHNPIPATDPTARSLLAVADRCSPSLTVARRHRSSLAERNLDASAREGAV